MSGTPLGARIMAKEPDRLGRAGAGGHGVNAARRLIKHPPCRNGPLRLPIDLEAQIAFEHVTQDEAGMLVTVRTGSRRRDHLDDRHLPAVHRDVGQAVIEDHAVGLRLVARLDGTAGGAGRRGARREGQHQSSQARFEEVTPLKRDYHLG